MADRLADAQRVLGSIFALKHAVFKFGIFFLENRKVPLVYR